MASRGGSTMRAIGNWPYLTMTIDGPRGQQQECITKRTIIDGFRGPHQKGSTMRTLGNRP